MEREEGMVIEITKELAKIQAGKHSDCKNCGACPGNNTAFIVAKNEIGAVPGQRVVFVVDESNSLKGAFIIFILPLLSIFLGAALGGYLAKLAESPALPGRIIGGLIAFGLVAVFIKIFDHYVGQKAKSLPVITKIL